MAHRPPPPPPRRRKSPAHAVLSNQTPWAVCVGDCIEVLRTMPAECVHTVVTSPPYWALRDYGVDGQLGWEESPEAYTAALCEVMAAVWRVLRSDGTLWLNLGDSYVDKGRVGVPWRVALAMMARGWTLRNEIIWHKTKIMPDWVQERFTRDHEQVFLFTKSPDYFFDGFALRKPSSEPGLMGRNRRTVWSIPTSVWKGAHFATFPVKLVDPCIKAGTSSKGACAKCGSPWKRVIERVGEEPKHIPRVKDEGRSGRGDLGHLRNEEGTLVWGDLGPATNVGRWHPKWRHVDWEPSCGCGAGVVPCVVLDPFIGSGTTLVGATRLFRRGIGIDLSPEHAAIAEDRIRNDFPLGALSTS